MESNDTIKSTSMEDLSFDEVSHFKSFLRTIGTNTEDEPVCSIKDFQEHCEKYLENWLSLQLSEKLSMENTAEVKSQISVTGFFLEFMTAVFEGTFEEKVACFVDIAASEPFGTRNTFTRYEILKYARSIVESYLKTMHDTRQALSWQGCRELTSQSISDLADFLLQNLVYDGVPSKEVLTKKPQKSLFSLDEIRESLEKFPLLVDIQSSVYSDCFNYQKSLYTLQLIPQCIHENKELCPSEFTMLNLAQVIFINSQLLFELRKQWRYLFSELCVGESFPRMMEGRDVKGPTLIIIKENNGRIFGAFFDDSWAVDQELRGSGNHFLFHLHPKMVVVPSTGFNMSYQHLFNRQHHTLPGVGMLGIPDYVAMWLEVEFGQGKCAQSSTSFAAFQHSLEQKFDVHTLEVWGVGPEPEEEKEVLDDSIVFWSKLQHGTPYTGFFEP